MILDSELDPITTEDIFDLIDEADLCETVAAATRYIERLKVDGLLVATTVRGVYLVESFSGESAD